MDPPDPALVDPRSSPGPRVCEAKRDFSIEMDGETRGVARRLADGLEAQQRSLDEVDRRLSAAKAGRSRRMPWVGWGGWGG